MKYLLYTILFFVGVGCKTSTPEIADYGNPAAEGFNLEESDAEAIAIADKVMERMGGRKAWDDTRYIKWNFFNSRRHVWDKHTNNVVIEGIRDTFLIKMNLDKIEGEVNYQGNQLTKADSLEKYLQRGKEMWINDAYWLLMPYKLKDSGVTLKYIGQDTTATGVQADVLQLTFADVGVTPENKYHVYVDPVTEYLVQWDFYTKFTDTVPRFSTPWDNYQQHGKIKLSGDRGGRRQLTEIAVGDTLASYFR
jgi:hypothetical protein